MRLLRGAKAAVLVPMQDWQKLAASGQAHAEGVAVGQSRARRAERSTTGRKTPARASQTHLTLMYILDTNVVSELRRIHPHGAVLAWVESVDGEDLHLSAGTIGEIQAGIEATREQDPDKAAEIDAWLEQVAETYNILSIDGRTFRSWARLMHRKSDHAIEDAMIAAIAMVHNLIVVTRNVRDLKDLGIQTLNPFKYET
jgi:toxin FitB